MTTLPLSEIAPRPNLRIRVAEICEKISLVLLFGFALAAPHSIAGSQGGFLGSALFWLLSSIVAGRFKLHRTALDLPLLALFGWAILSSCFSYEPKVSLNGLRSLAFFSVIYLVVSHTVETKRARWLALTLIGSSLINVGYTIYQRTQGQGLAIVTMQPKSRLLRVGLVEGDVIISADGKPVTSLQMLSDLVDAGPEKSSIHINFRHGEMPLELDMPRRRIQRARNLTGTARFGIDVAPARDFRAHGFYNHYATYAEVLQLLASLAIGFLLVAPRKWLTFAGFALIVLGLLSALIFTATRAPLVALAISAFAMLLLTKGMRRYLLIGLVLVALPVGLYAINKWRRVGFIDMNDGSTTWRLEIWQEGLQLVKKHPIFGIGKGSERTHWKEWGLYRNGELPPGHFHSTPLQIAVWYGIPAMLCYFSVMGTAIFVLARELLKIRKERSIPWQQHAVLLGAMGGVIGFTISGMVHFNFGDGEVTMVLWLIIGLAMAELINLQKSAAETQPLNEMVAE